MAAPSNVVTSGRRGLAGGAWSTADLAVADQAARALLLAADQLDRLLTERSAAATSLRAGWRGVCRNLFDDDLARLTARTAELRDQLRREAGALTDRADRAVAVALTHAGGSRLA